MALLFLSVCASAHHGFVSGVVLGHGKRQSLHDPTRQTMKRMLFNASRALICLSLVGVAPALANEAHHDQHREKFCYWDDDKGGVVCEWRWEN